MPRPQAIMPVKQDDYFINMGLFGPPGAGKSALAGSGGAKTLLLLHNSDEASSVAQLGFKAQKWIVPTCADLEEAYEYCRHDGFKEFDWVWWDNTTLMQEYFMDDLMTQVVAAKPHRNRFVPDKPEYQQIQNQLSVMMRNFCALPMHFGWTAHVMEATDMDENLVNVPLIQGTQGSLSQKFCGYMNVMGYMPLPDKDGRKLFVSKRGRVYAKSRWSGLQGTITNPSIPKIEQLVRSKFPQLGNPPEASAPRKVSAAKVAAKKAGAAKKAAPVKRAAKATKATKATKKIGAR